jgi:hypothetical protein
VVDKRALARAEEAIQATIAQADRCVSLEDADGVLARRDLLSVLEAADVHLAKRIAAITPKRDGTMKFSQAQAITYRTQVGLVIERVKFQLEPVATEAGQAAIDKSLVSGARLLAKLEKEFKGVSVSPSLLAGMQQSQVARGTQASLVTRVATSLDRYGLEMGQQFSRILQVGLVSGMSNEEMVAQLIGLGGPRGKVSLKAKEIAPGVVQRIKEGDIPEGLFVRHKYWAERIVRTEVAYAHSSAKLEQLYVMRNDGLPVQKKIVAHFDNRTAADSVAVHGQIRELAENFMDGAGRLYLHPPGRPNDRETLIPWFDDWKETPSTEPPTPEEIERAEKLEKGELVAPPPTTVEELEQVKELSEQARVVEVPDDPETAAAERLLQLERERIASQQALARLQEEERQAAAEYKARQELQQLDAKTRKAFALKGTEHEAALDLVRLTAHKPELAQRLYNYAQGTQVPSSTFTIGAKKSAEVFDQITKELIGSYGSLEPLLLEQFKKSPAFAPFLERLEKAGDARSQQLLAALVHTEQSLFMTKGAKALPWRTSVDIAKKSPGYAVEQLRKKYLPQGNPFEEKYRALYGDLAARIGAAEARMEEALGLTLDEAIERAKKLDHTTGTERFLQELQTAKRQIIVLRDKTTLGEMAAAAASYTHDIRGHAALLGHVKDLPAIDAKKLIGKPTKALLAEPAHVVQGVVSRAERGAQALATMLHEELDPVTTPGNLRAAFSGTPALSLSADGRAYAERKGIALAVTDSIATVAHELSHLTCFRHPHLGDAERAFLKARAQGLTPRKLKDITGNQRYGDNEVAYEAGFVRPYTAREYGAFSGGSNEITAMGSTHIFEGGVSELVQKDPAHLFFTLSQYRGGK